MKRIFSFAITLCCFISISFAETSSPAYDAYLDGDYAKAKTLWMKRASSNDASAMVMLGRLFQNGLGVKTNYSQAASWFEKASAHNSAQGHFYLARLYQHGLGVERDIAKAVALYQSSIALGYSRAKGELADIYQSGLVGKKNVSLAKLLYKQEGSQRSLKQLAAINQQENCLTHNVTRLFEVTLKCADRAHLRKAITDHGLKPKLVSKSNLGDAYYSADFLDGSTELRVGYTRDDQFATAKFVFPHRWAKDIIQDLKSELSSELGEPSHVYGGLDQEKMLYKWIREDRIEINLYRDMTKRTTYLSYTYPDHRKLLLAELN